MTFLLCGRSSRTGGAILLACKNHGKRLHHVVKAGSVVVTEKRDTAAFRVGCSKFQRLPGLNRPSWHGRLPSVPYAFSARISSKERLREAHGVQLPIERGVSDANEHIAFGSNLYATYVKKAKCFLSTTPPVILMGGDYAASATSLNWISQLADVNVDADSDVGPNS
ncbi:hypothetical protein B0H19DRAFT_1080208 [Mycena capillaripes]|nr:hypothetical protein B0H19DRAFT_1080208 [Mycena capillaripes]